MEEQQEQAIPFLIYDQTSRGNFYFTFLQNLKKFKFKKLIN